jgi:hypothetical protein
MAEPILDFFALFGPIPPAGAAMGIDALRALHAKHGVAGAVALSTRGIYHSAPAGNRETIRQCSESGGALLPAAVLDPRQPHLDTSFEGARVLGLFPATQNWPVRWLPVKELLSKLVAAKTTAPLLFEASRPGDTTTLFELLAEVDWQTPVVLVGLDDATLPEASAAARRDERLHLATDGLVGVGQLAMVAELTGIERLVFGSGAISRSSLAATLATVRASGLDAAAQSQILTHNARRLLAMGGAA